MAANEDLDRLVALACEWEAQPEWLLFSRYMQFRGRGQRDAALSSLDEFVRRVSDWSFERRLAFARCVLTESLRFKDPDVLIAQPLHTGVLVPILREWSANDPREAQAYLWLGLLRCDDPSEHLTRALELDPSLAIGRQTLINWILGDVEYNQHELPRFYIHDPRKDLKLLDQAEELIRGVVERARAEQFRQEASKLRTRARDWLTSHPDGLPATNQ